MKLDFWMNKETVCQAVSIILSTKNVGKDNIKDKIQLALLPAGLSRTIYGYLMVSVELTNWLFWPSVHLFKLS